MTKHGIRELKATPSKLSLLGRTIIKKVTAPELGKPLPPLAVSLRNVTANQNKIHDFCKVCGFPVSGTMPVTYPQIIAFPLQTELLVSNDFPYPVVGLLHLGNEITQYRNIGNYEALDFVCELSGPRVVSKGLEFELTTHVSVKGSLVWKSVITIMHRCKTGVTQSGQATTKRKEFTPEHSVTWPVPEDTGRRYAGVSGDANLIHLHAVTARFFGFKKAIAHGMWTKSHALGELSAVLPAPPFKVDVQFKLPVYLPNTVKFQYRRDEDDIEFYVKDGRGRRPHLEGKVTALPGRES